jgi:hypothetical protein
LPSDARTPTRPRPTSWTYCFTPPPFEITIEEYPAPSLPLVPRSVAAVRQISLPVFLSRATSSAFFAPGVTSSRSPSTSGDSLHVHIDIIWPPKSAGRLLRQRSLPVAASRATRSPAVPSAYTRSPSTVGVPRGPPYWSTQGAPTFADQSFLPSVAESAMTCWAPSTSPIVKTRPFETDTLEKPVPRPDAFQASAGPVAGHARSRPVSLETPSRLGPRHPGQPTDAGGAARVRLAPATARAATAANRRIMKTSE